MKHKFLKNRFLTAGLFLLLVWSSAACLGEGKEAGQEVRIELEQDNSRASGKGVEIRENIVTVTEKGSYRISGSLSDGQIRVDTPGKEVVLLLDGASVTGSGRAAVYVEEAERVTILLEEGTENALQSRKAPEKKAEEKEAGTAVFSGADLVIGGTGLLDVKGEDGHGVQSRKDLCLEEGRIRAEAGKDGFKADGVLRIDGGSIEAVCEEKAFQADEGLEMTGGFVRAEAGDDALHSNRNAGITGGTLQISSVKKGIHADEELTVEGGTIRITDSLEGLEANRILIREGKISIAASDDGINANGEPEEKDGRQLLPCLSVQGGEISIDADGDGLDSNGDLIVGGGTIVIFGPEDDQNGALDYGRENGGRCLLNGGTVLAAGSSGMAVGFSEESGQPSFLCFLDSVCEAGEEIRILDGKGEQLFACTAGKRVSSVVFGSPELEIGGRYLLEAGEESVRITMESDAVTVRGSQLRGSVP